MAGVVNLTSNAAISTDTGTLALNGGVSEGSHTLTVKGPGTTVIGAITGTSGGLTVNAASGLVDLTGSNTYGGTTTITNGTLELGNGGSGGSLSTSSTIVNNGNLTINRSNAVVQGTDFTATATSGNGSFTQAGTGTTTLSSANTYHGGTTVSSGGLIVGSNGTNGSATGSGALTLAAGTTLGGAGQINASSFALGGAGTNASVIVEKNGPTRHSQLTLTGTGANTITNTQLNFNISAVTAGQGNELSVGSSGIAFSNSTLALNVAGTGIISAYTPYVLIAGTGGNGTVAGSQYTGLTINNETIDGQNFAVITGGLNLTLAPSLANSWYGTNSFLFLNTSGGVDDIEVDVVPEPGTWAMILGGMAVLIFIQRRRVKNNRLG